MEEPSKTPPTHADLARDLRQALDALGDVVEAANNLTCDVEDAAGLAYPGGEPPDPADVKRNTLKMPATLTALAEIDNRMRRQVWLFARARRGLAQLHLGGNAGKLRQIFPKIAAAGSLPPPEPTVPRVRSFVETLRNYKKGE